MSLDSTTRPASRLCKVCGLEFQLNFSHGIAVGLAKIYCSRKCGGIGRRGERVPIRDRFWDKVNKDGPIPVHRPELGPCWIWTAATNGVGYGLIGVAGRTCNALAHRLSWEWEFGPIPDGLFVLHHCDNPSCLRPSHLFLGDGSANSKDMIAKGRHTYLSDPNRDARGEMNTHATLTDDLVREIRRRKAAGEKSTSISRALGVGKGAVDGVWYNKTWTHVV